MAYTTIDDPSAHFQVKIWSGNGTAGTAITFDGNSNLQPDLFWGKTRNHAYNHIVLDSTRGVTNKRIIPNATDAEDTYAGFMDSFDSDGFTLDSDVNTNESAKTYVAWCWKANGGTRTTNTESGNNPAGGYQANTTGGFSIVDYTGTGAAGTMAHGLGAVPKVMIVKNRDSITDWGVYHRNASAAGNDSYLELNTSDAAATAGSVWNDTSPTSSVFTVGTNTKTNTDGEKYMAYCFTEIQGYSKFGSYTGNGNANGPFIYTGFKPAWVLVKVSTGSNRDWRMIDNKRDTYNLSTTELKPNSSATETTSAMQLDLLSNGFKIRTSSTSCNDSETYVYMAFAEQPFVSSEGVPCTAR